MWKCGVVAGELRFIVQPIHVVHNQNRHLISGASFSANQLSSKDTSHLHLAESCFPSLCLGVFQFAMSTAVPEPEKPTETFNEEKEQRPGAISSTAEEERRAVRKLDVPFLGLLGSLYLVAYIDRGNIGNAYTAGLGKSWGITQMIILGSSQSTTSLTLSADPCY